MTGKKIKQINNLTIRFTEENGYAVWTPDGKCWEDRMTLAQAEEYCRGTTDFVKRRKKDIEDFKKQYMTGVYKP